jgi:hypothetical protein
MKRLGIHIAFLLALLVITACEQGTAYRTYENGRLPYILDVPETWEMDESNPLFINFLNDDHTLSISCEIGEFTLIPERHYEAFYDYLYEEHEDSIFNKSAIQKTDSLYILNWKGKDGVYVFDGSKIMNGYLCGIQVAATAETLEEGQTIFQHVFQSIRPNPNFIAPPQHEDDDEWFNLYDD